ncbi:KCNH7 [Symbiodinium microadriaticum]|nr:KCNH7 [Symbiodinium microadriaticum]CAE7557523.1 KCNH7 [Symbiodinium sp. KB8]
MPSPSPKKAMDGLLGMQLEALRESVLQQHHKEVGELRKTIVELRHQLYFNDTDAVSVSHEAIAHGSAVGRWADFAAKLLDKDEESTEAEPDQEKPNQMETLNMRPVWFSSTWQEAAKNRRMRGYRVSDRHSLPQIRMSDDLTDSTCLQRFVLRPRSKPQLTWSLLGTLLILWDLITIPLELFNIPGSIDFFTTTSRITLAFWIVDMPLNLCFGVERGGRVELRPTELFKIYLRSWFVLDVLVISLDVVLMVVEIISTTSTDDQSNTGLRSARFLRTMRLLRLLRLLRAVKLQQELTLLANRFLSAHVFMVAKVVFGLLMMLAINHIIACLWYGIGYWTALDGKSWLEQAELLGDEVGFADRYAVSLHWTLTQFTPATNNVAPDNALERFFAVWVILLAMGVFSSFISSITATVSKLQNSRVEQFQQRAKLLRFFVERNLSADLYGKIEDVLRQEGLFEVRIKEHDVKLVEGIPERLKMQLHEEMFMSILSLLPFWPKWVGERDSLLHRLICHQAMREGTAVPGQDAFIAGANAEEVYIIESGSLNYVYLNNQRHEDTVSAEDIVSLPCIFAEWKHRGRLYAHHSACYWVGLNAVRFCNLIADSGGVVWQHLHIFGILLVGAIEDRSWMINDINWSMVGVDALCTRTVKFANILNENHGTTSASLALLKSYSSE